MCKHTCLGLTSFGNFMLVSGAFCCDDVRNHVMGGSLVRLSEQQLYRARQTAVPAHLKRNFK